MIDWLIYNVQSNGLLCALYTGLVYKWGFLTKEQKYFFTIFTEKLTGGDNWENKTNFVNRILTNIGLSCLKFIDD